jgi:hypothetical protein
MPKAHRDRKRPSAGTAKHATPLSDKHDAKFLLEPLADCNEDQGFMPAELVVIATDNVLRISVYRAAIDTDEPQRASAGIVLLEFASEGGRLLSISAEHLGFYRLVAQRWSIKLR